MGRVIREEKGPFGSGGPGAATSIVDFEYGPCGCSPLGKIKRQSQPYAPGGSVYWTTYTYDGAGRTLTVTGPDGQSRTKLIYNNLPTAGPYAVPASGNSVTTIDPAGRWKIVTTDMAGRIVQVTEPNPSAAGQAYLTTYEYDRYDLLTRVNMPRDGQTQTRSFVYDYGSGSQLPPLTLLSETHPETGTTTYTYALGAHGESLRVVKQDANGQQIKVETTDRDAYNRPKKIRFLKPMNGDWVEDVCQQVNYTYDTYPASAGASLGNSGWGRVTTSQVGTGGNDAACKLPGGPQDGSRYNQSFLQAFGYTGSGQVATKRLLFTQVFTNQGGTAQPATGKTWDTSYTYDDEGYETGVTYFTGTSYQTGRDFLKRPYSYFQQSNPLIQSVGYNAAD